MPIAAIPLELVLQILEYVYLDGRSKPHKYFQNQSLVCKAWTPFAQRLLFRTVRLHAFSSTQGFLAATNPTRHRDGDGGGLGRYVRILEVTLFTKEMKALLPYVIRHCTNLYELNLTLVGPMDLSTFLRPPRRHPASDSTTEGEEVDYTKMALPNIKAFRINATRLSSNPGHVRSIVKLFPTIQHLVLLGETAYSDFSVVGDDKTNDGNDGEEVAKPIEVHPKLELYELQVLSSGWELTRPETLQTLTQHSIGTLAILDISGLPVNIILLPSMDEFWNTHGPHLRSLRLPSFGSQATLPKLSHCTRLEELVVPQYPPACIRNVLPVKKMEHLSFVTRPPHNKYPLRPLFRWMEGLTRLRVVTWRAEGVLKGDREAMEKFCDAKGVRLRLSVKVVPEFDTEEFIRPFSFPRDEIYTPLWR